MVKRYLILTGRILGTLVIFTGLVLAAVAALGPDAPLEYYGIALLITLMSAIGVFVLYMVLMLLWGRDPFDPKDRM